jgi:hypothetical protein
MSTGDLEEQGVRQHAAEDGVDMDDSLDVRVLGRRRMQRRVDSHISEDDGQASCCGK